MAARCRNLLEALSRQEHHTECSKHPGKPRVFCKKKSQTAGYWAGRGCTTLLNQALMNSSNLPADAASVPGSV